MNFNFHYNKPASKKAKRNKLTIHFGGKCCIVSRIVCKVPISSKSNKTQPRCTLVGEATNIKISNNTAYIN
jgi:hypothetical protein